MVLLAPLHVREVCMNANRNTSAAYHKRAINTQTGVGGERFHTSCITHIMDSHIDCKTEECNCNKHLKTVPLEKFMSHLDSAISTTEYK